MKIKKTFYLGNSINQNIFITLIIVFSFIGFFSYLKQYLFAFGFLIFIIPFIAKKAFEIDLMKMKYRHCYVLFKFKFGRWKLLQPIQYVSLFNINAICETEDGRNIFGKLYQINLFDMKNNHITAFESDNKWDSFKLAKKISEFLNVEFLDKTTLSNGL